MKKDGLVHAHFYELPTCPPYSSVLCQGHETFERNLLTERPCGKKFSVVFDSCMGRRGPKLWDPSSQAVTETRGDICRREIPAVRKYLPGICAGWSVRRQKGI